MTCGGSIDHNAHVMTCGGFIDPNAHVMTCGKILVVGIIVISLKSCMLLKFCIHFLLVLGTFTLKF